MGGDGPVIRFVLRLFSLAALAVAVMAGTIDAIQSVAAAEPVLTLGAEAFAPSASQASVPASGRLVS